MPFNKDDELGGLWERKTKTGNHMLTGKIKLPDGGELEIVAFWNDKKQEGERTPDWRVYKGQPQRGQDRAVNPGPARQPARYAGERTAERGQPAPTARADHELDDSIPF